MKDFEKDIMKEIPKLQQIPYDIPEGYFSDLKKNLKSIPERENAVRSLTWRKVMTYAAIAAASALLIVAGGFYLSGIGQEDYFTEEDYIVFSEQMTSTIYYESSSQYADTKTMTQDDIVEYLIETGTEIEELEQY